MRNNNHLNFPVKKKVINKRKPNVATLKRLQMRRWSKVIEKRVEAEKNIINKDKTIETFNVQMNLEKLLENIVVTNAPPPPPPTPPPPTPLEARKSLRRKSQMYNNNNNKIQSSITSDNNKDRKKSIARRRSLKIDSSMITNNDHKKLSSPISHSASKSNRVNIDNKVVYLTKKKILQPSDYEKLLEVLQTIHPTAIINQNGIINTTFINWRKVQQYIREEYIH